MTDKMNEKDLQNVAGGQGGLQETFLRAGTQMMLRHGLHLGCFDGSVLYDMRD